MLPDELKSAIQSFYLRIATQLPGFRKRAGQREMIAFIARAFAHGAAQENGESIAVVEGRTGVGKTVGYLTPGIVMARAAGKKLVLSTGTVALQEQLFNRDLPAVLKCFDQPVNFALLKGRGRFVCSERLASVGGHAGQDTLFGDAVWDRRPEEKEIRFLRKIAVDFDEGHWNGERDTLSEPPPDELWGRIANDGNTCPGRSCPSYKGCAYFSYVEKVRVADVIVANHDLVLACIAANSQLLPPPEETFYVFDEAHHLPGVALNRFALDVSTASKRWIERIPAAFGRILQAFPAPGVEHDIERLVRDSLTQISELESGLRHGSLFAGEARTARLAGGLLTDDFQTLIDALKASASELADLLAEILDMAEAAGKENATAAVSIKKAMIDASFSLGRLEHFEQALSMFALPSCEGQPVAKWISQEKGNKQAISYRLHASPILAGPILAEHLWKRAAGVALASATITTLGDFRYFLKDSGLNLYPNVATVSVASPFDYPEQGVLSIPKMRSDPGNSEAHTQELQALLPDLLLKVDHGALVLFASRKQMEAVHSSLPEALRASVLMQGTQARNKLLDAHASTVRSGQRSILFGLAGFGEGLDLPGQLCEHVLIAKIPFAAPDSPIDEAKSEWIEANGGNAFADLMLPKAGLTLVQWVGRLIRNEDDRGQVVIFDTRMRTKRYGSQLLSSLPDFRRIAA